MVHPNGGYLRHPGGSEVMTAVAGKSDQAGGSEGFEDCAHSDSARLQCNQFIVGYLEGYEHRKTGNMPSLSEINGGGMKMLSDAVPVLIAVAGLAAGYFFFYNQ